MVSKAKSAHRFREGRGRRAVVASWKPRLRLKASTLRHCQAPPAAEQQGHEEQDQPEHAVVRRGQRRGEDGLLISRVHQYKGYPQQSSRFLGEMGVLGGWFDELGRCCP